MKKRRGQAERGLPRKSRNLRLAGIERFEDRLLLTVYLVTNTQDNPTTGSPNDGTLRGEIEESNANPATGGGINEIDFSFTTTGVQKISLQALLPAITAPLLINGSTSDGFTNSPLVQVDGSNVNVGAGTGLSVMAASSEIRDLDITGFAGDGIDLDGGTDLVDGCYIGVDPTGGAIVANTGVGVFVSSNLNTIGGLTSGPNVISGNGTGIQIQGGLATDNTITHNFVGTDATGLKNLGNTSYGIEDQASSNTIGGSSADGPNGLGNLVSGNVSGGINISSQAGSTLVEGNYVGTDLTGEAALPNGFVGVYLNSVTNTTIGGLSGSGAGNLISGNGAAGASNGYGVEVSGTTTSNVFIQGNYIGVGANGIAPLGNRATGVFISGSNTVTVGGTTLLGNTSKFGNIIAYNGIPTLQYGVEVMDASMDGILGNSIYSNGNLGIKLNQGNSGVTPPTITSAQAGGGQTEITGSYFGSPNTSYRIQFFSSQSQNPSGAGDGQNYLGDLDFTTNSVGQFKFSTVLMTGVPVGAYLSATATQGVLTVNNTSQFATNAQVTKALLSDLSVTAVPSSVTALLDEPYTYTLTVTNNGPDADTGVVLTDKIPANTTYTPQFPPVGTFSAGVFTDDIGDLAANASVTVMVTVKPYSTTSQIVNTASVTGNELDVNLLNNTATTTSTVAPNADLSVVLVPSVDPAPVGSPITYTLVVGNNGPSAANHVITTVQFPADFTSISANPDQGTYTVDSNNLVTINTGTIPASSSSTIILVATPTSAGIAPTTATVKTNPVEADPNPSNNTVTVPVTVANAADLGVTIAAAPASGASTALIGQPLLYTIDVTNDGPSSASEPVVVDTLPAGVTYDGSSAGGHGTIAVGPGGVVTANLFALPPNATYEITIAVTPTASGQVVNTATVGDPDEVNPVEIDPNLANNTATATTLVSPADLQVTIDEPSSFSPLFIGTPVVYQVTVTNNGPATANNVVLLDSFNSGATILSSSVGQPSGSGLSVNLGGLLSGSSTTVDLTVVPTLAGYTGTLTDSASVSSDEIDPNPDNNSTSTSNLVSPVDVGVVVTSSSSSILLGQPILYAVAVTNAGPATASSVSFTDAFPAGSTLDAVSISQGSVLLSTTAADTLIGTFTDLAPGATASISILVTPGATGTATNTLTATPFEVDTNKANNTGSASVSVINLPGSLQFTSPQATVPEDGGSVTLTVDRTGGTLGEVSVDYATSDLSAVSGVNYVATSGTLFFADGQTTATITIPVLDDMVVDGDTLFLVTLSDPTDGASLGSPSVATVDVTNTDRDTTPPVVSSLTAIPNGSSIDGFIITFDKAMDPTRASFVGNYHLFLTNGGTGQTPIALAGAIYNPSNDSVTVVPTAPLPGNRFYRIVVNGSTGFVLTDTSGNILSGSSGPNSNYDVSYGQGTNLTYTDAQDNSVNLKLSGGGTMQVFRATNGDASTVNLVGIVPHKSKLTGSVKKLKKPSSGHTYIGSITGFGQFGNVFSTLTTPSFYVGYAPVSAASVSVPNIVSVESTTAAQVTVAKKTPKGPKVSQK